MFLENCRAEIEGTLRRLRNHPSVLLWSGGNEQYLGASSTKVGVTRITVFMARTSDTGEAFADNLGLPRNPQGH